MSKDKVLEIAKHISEYTSNTKPKHISGSQFGSEPLQLWLENKYGKDDNDFIVGQNTIGSIFHKGMEQGASELYGEEVSTELKVERVLPNGWTVTGTIDLVDHENKEIIDYKTSKMYAMPFVKKEPRHGYKLQLNAYKWASKLEEYDMYLAWFMKDNKDIAGEKVYYKQKLEDIKTFEQEAVMFTDELQGFIDRDEEPAKCDQWMRMDNTKAKGGKLVPSRCLLYCDVSKHCKHLGDFQRKQFNAKRLING